MDLSICSIISLRTLAKNKLRSGLTVLGVVIGIAAVTTMVSIGQGASQLVRNEFQNLGSNVIVVLPASRPERRRPSGNGDDADRGGRHRHRRRVSRGAGGLAARRHQRPGHRRQRQLAAARHARRRPRLPPRAQLAAGRAASSSPSATSPGRPRYASSATRWSTQLFPDTDPIGQQVRVKNIPFTVVGVLSRKGANLVGQDQDDIILMPYTTVRKRLQASAFANVDVVLVSAHASEQSAQAEQEIRALLGGTPPHRRPAKSRTVEVRNTAEMANVFNVITGTLTAMLSAIAAISLVVGGVGIMNIMLVSVTERTREIGIRMALGARPRDILRQFLVESVVLSSIGGVIGHGAGRGGVGCSSLWIINCCCRHPIGRSWCRSRPR